MAVTFADLSDTTVTLEWEPVAGAEQYKVYVASNADGTGLKINGSYTSDLFFEDVGAWTSLTSGTTYYARIVPIAAGDVAMTDKQTPWTPFTTL